jgi:hypothetical protein
MSSKIVIKSMANNRDRREKLYKIVKLVNYDSVSLIDTIFTEDQVTTFLNCLDKKVSYEILGA